jgi:hypothetical protein
MALGVATSAQAQFGGLLGAAKGGGGDVGALVEEFNRDADNINEAVTYSLIQIVAALGDKEQIAKVKALNDSLSKTTDPKEKGSIQGTVLKDQSTVANEVLKSQDAKDKISKMSPAMQKKVAQSIFAVGVASLRIPLAVDKGKKIIEGIGSNPLNITKVLPVKNGLSTFADVVPKLPSIVTTGVKLMRDVKVDPGNATKDSPLVANKEIDFPDTN